MLHRIPGGDPFDAKLSSPSWRTWRRHELPRPRSPRTTSASAAAVRRNRATLLGVPRARGVGSMRVARIHRWSGRRRRAGRAGGCVDPATAGSVADARSDGAALDRTRAPSRPSNGGLPAGAGRLLRGDRRPPCHEARGECVSVRSVLHLRAALNRQDTASSRSGVANPRAGSVVPCPRGDQRHRLDVVGRDSRQLLVRSRRRGPAAHGSRRLRRADRRHLGAERAVVRGSAGRRQRARQHARLPQRSL